MLYHQPPKLYLYRLPPPPQSSFTNHLLNLPLFVLYALPLSRLHLFLLYTLLKLNPHIHSPSTLTTIWMAGRDTRYNPFHSPTLPLISSHHGSTAHTFYSPLPITPSAPPPQLLPYTSTLLSFTSISQPPPLSTVLIFLHLLSHLIHLLSHLMVYSPLFFCPLILFEIV